MGFLLRVLIEILVTPSTFCNEVFFLGVWENLVTYNIFLLKHSKIKVVIEFG